MELLERVGAGSACGGVRRCSTSVATHCAPFDIKPCEKSSTYRERDLMLGHFSRFSPCFRLDDRVSCDIIESLSPLRVCSEIAAN